MTFDDIDPDPPSWMVVKPRIIAFDFDDTITADPEMVFSFMAMARHRGHRVLCVTARYFTPENKEDLKEVYDRKYPVYFTGHSPKRWYMESQGVKVDIWFDDSPEVIVHGV